MSGTQVSSFTPVNQLLQNNAQQITNYYAPRKNELLIQGEEQKINAQEMEFASRAALGLLNLPDEAAMAAAYPGVVAEGQRYGFLKNAPSVFPGKARLQQIASMGVPAKDQYEQQGVAGDYNAWAARRNAGLGTGTGATTAAPGGGAATVATAPGPIEGDAQARAFAVRDGLIKRGIDADTATAFAANALHESSARPDTGPGDRGASHGLFQWRDDRFTRYQKIMGNAPDNAPLDQQLDYVVHELNTTEGAARDRIAAAQGPAAKAAAISQYYLRPKDVQAEMARRSATATQLAGALPNVTSGMSDQAWLDQMARQYPSLGGPNANPNQPNLGGQTPAPYQTASLTPTPPPSGATPAAPAQPAATTTAQGTAPAQQPPVAAVPSVQPPPPRMQNGLTAEQNGTLQQLQAIRPRNRAEFDALQQKVATTEAQFRKDNDTEERQYRQEVRQAQKDAAAADAAAKKEAREAANDAALQKSKSDEADAERVLLAYGPKLRRGEPLTEEEADQYDIARRRYARGPLQIVSDGHGGTTQAFVGQEVPDRFPLLPGQKEYAGVKPIPGTEKPPEMASPQIVGGMLANATGMEKILKAQLALEEYSGAVGAKGNLPEFILQRADPEGVKARAAISDVGGHEFHDMSGAAISQSEGRRLTYIPTTQDTEQAVKTKMQRLLETNRETLLKSYRTYGPENNGRRLPEVEAAIVESIPEVARNAHKNDKDPQAAKKFDQVFGRGASKLVLNYDG